MSILWLTSWLLALSVLFHSGSLQSKGPGSSVPSDALDDPGLKQEATCRELTKLRLLTMLPYPDKQFRPSWDQGDDILPAMELAAEQINNRSDILPCHQLELVNVDSGCNIVPKTSVKIVENLFYESKQWQFQKRDTDNQTIIGVIGPGCTISTKQVSDITNRPEVELVILHDAGSPLFANRTKYKNSISILGSIQPFASVSIALMRETKWRNIAILYDDTRLYYRFMAKNFISNLTTEMKDVRVLFEAPVLGTSYPLFEVRDSLARIVFVFVPLQHSRRIMCLAYHWKLVYPAYQWILVGQNIEDFVGNNGSQNFIYEGKQYSCSHEALLDIALNKSFMIHYQFADEQSEKPQLNMTFHEFLGFYEAKVKDYNDKNPNATIAPTYWAYNMYDAVWAWALILDNLTSKYGELTFEYGNKTLAKMILDEFYSVSFQGMSGNITFNSSNGFVNRQALLYQISNKSSQKISNGTNTFPKDSYITIPDIVKVIGLPHKELASFFIIFQCLELCAAIALHLFTIVYRRSKSVKASSLHLSHLAFIGLYLLIIATLVLSVSNLKEYTPAISSILCQILWVWLFPIGFTLVIGTVAVRTWRLYRIFAHYLDPGRFISTPALIAILIILLFIDHLIAIIWTVADPLQQVLVNFMVENGPANELMQDRMCSSEKLNLFWIATGHGYKLLLLTFMVMLTVLTRSIPNKTFTTSSLRVFSYTFSTTYLLGFTMYYLFLFTSHNPDAVYGTLSVTFNIMICLIIAFIVLPPLLPIAREKISTRK